MLKKVSFESLIDIGFISFDTAEMYLHSKIVLYLYILFIYDSKHQHIYVRQK